MFLRSVFQLLLIRAIFVRNAGDPQKRTMYSAFQNKVENFVEQVAAELVLIFVSIMSAAASNLLFRDDPCYGIFPRKPSVNKDIMMYKRSEITLVLRCETVRTNEPDELFEFSIA